MVKTYQDGQILYELDLDNLLSGNNRYEKTILNPGASEDTAVAFTDRDITVNKVIAILKGSASPSVTWTLRFAADRSATGTELLTGGSVTTSTTTGLVLQSFNDETIPANNFIWIETTAQSGTVNELHLTIIYTED